MSKLALEGGAPVRTQPFPKREPFGPTDAAQVLDALNQQTLFFPAGRKVYEFQTRFGELYGVNHVTMSTSGTAAIHVAVGALDPEPGDEIITTPVSDMGTVSPIIMQNAIPVFADVDPLTLNLDPDDVEAKITSRTRAIIVVHCWGQPAEMDRFVAIAHKHNLVLIEDCSQAHYTRYQGKLVGTIGDVGAFSLQDSKHLQCGEGGITITNDDRLGERAAHFIDKGCTWSPDRKVRLKYAFIGPCYRMTELQGAVLLAQLPRLPEIVKRRQELGERLRHQLLDVPGILPPGRLAGAEHSYWAFPIRILSDVLGITPAEFGAALGAEGIPSGAWLGKPLHMFDALSEQITFGQSHFPFGSTYNPRPVHYGPGLCPTAEMVVAHLRTLALHEQYTEADIDDIGAGVRKVAEAYAVRARKMVTV